MIDGPDEATAALIAWAHRGPPAARVDTVTNSAIEGTFSGFEQRATG